MKRKGRKSEKQKEEKHFRVERKENGMTYTRTNTHTYTNAHTLIIHQYIHSQTQSQHIYTYTFTITHTQTQTNATHHYIHIHKHTHKPLQWLLSKRKKNHFMNHFDQPQTPFLGFMSLRVLFSWFLVVTWEIDFQVSQENNSSEFLRQDYKFFWRCLGVGWLLAAKAMWLLVSAVWILGRCVCGVCVFLGGRGEAGIGTVWSKLLEGYWVVLWLNSAPL